MTTIRTILHPTDFSGQSERAFRLTCSLARDHGARVIVLHVVPPPACRGEAIARQPPDGYHEQLWNTLCHVLPRSPGIRLEHRLVDGDPGEEILRIAEDENCDLIVMGTHARTGLKRLLTGSVAEQVMRSAPCAVTTVRGTVPAGELETLSRTG